MDYGRILLYSRERDRETENTNRKCRTKRIRNLKQSKCIIIGKKKKKKESKRLL